MHTLRTVRNKTHDTEALVRACSAWAVRGSKNTDIQFWKDVGNGILLDRPLSFKLHQSYRPLPCLFPRCKKFGRIPRKTVRWWRWWPQHRGRISLPRWSGNAVIVTALLTHTVMAKNIGTLGECDQRRLWKWCEKHDFYRVWRDSGWRNGLWSLFRCSLTSSGIIGEHLERLNWQMEVSKSSQNVINGWR